MRMRRWTGHGCECGIGLEEHRDIKPGDVIEAYAIERIVRRYLDSPQAR